MGPIWQMYLIALSLLKEMEETFFMLFEVVFGNLINISQKMTDGSVKSSLKNDDA